MNMNYSQDVLNSVEDMRRSGMNDTGIAIAIDAIRAWAIREERIRLGNLLDQNPPEYPNWVEFRNSLPERI